MRPIVWKDPKWMIEVMDTFLERSKWCFLRLRQDKDTFEIWLAPKENVTTMVIITYFQKKYLMIYVVDGSGYEKMVETITEMVISCLDFPKTSFQLYYPELKIRPKNGFDLKNIEMIELKVYGWGDPVDCIFEWQRMENFL